MYIGRYRVLKELGSGGMGRVSLAEAPSGRLVVIKRPIRPDPDLNDRMVDEARAGSRLAHPHVVETLDLLQHNGVPHLVVAYVYGASLSDIRRIGPLTPPVAARIGRQLASALRALHGATGEDGTHLQMLHRDVTPSNVLLGVDGDVRLIDLGIVRSAESVAAPTARGFLRGKIRYLAPELFGDGMCSVASDLWGLGLVIVEGLLGRQVLPRSHPEVIGRLMRGHVLDGINDDELDVRLRPLLEGLLAPQPQDRPVDAAEVEAGFAMLEKQMGYDRALSAASQLARFAAEAREGTEELLTVVPDDGSTSATFASEQPTRAEGLPATVRGGSDRIHSVETEVIVGTHVDAAERGAAPAGGVKTEIESYLKLLRSLEFDGAGRSDRVDATPW